MSTWKASITAKTAPHEGAVGTHAGGDSVAEPVVITVYEKTQKLPRLDEFSLEILSDDEVGADPYNRSGNCR